MIEYIFEGDYYGIFKLETGNIQLDLKCMGTLKNEDDMIEKIYYTMNHELIHVIQNLHKEITHINHASEREVYHMIGNGKNKFFHEFYNIPENKKWMAVINA